MYCDSPKDAYILHKIPYKNYEHGNGDFDFVSDRFSTTNCASNWLPNRRLEQISYGGTSWILILIKYYWGN
jgi:hypothetical protein